MKHIFLMIFVSGLIAQDFDSPERDPDRSDKMEMMMIWKLTDELDLTPEQAEKFFPRFRKHRNELDEVKKMERALAGEMRQKMGEDEDLSEKMLFQNSNINNNANYNNNANTKKTQSTLKEEYLKNASTRCMGD